jgi:transposase-like protein
VSKNNVVKLYDRDKIADPLTEQLIYQAVEAELQELLAEHAGRRTEDGKAGVVRNGHLPGRQLQTGLGPVTVRVPKVRAKTGEPVTFRFALVPPYVRKTRSLEAALPWLVPEGSVQRREAVSGH